MFNEKGSIPLVLIVVFSFGIAVTVLTQLFLSESLTAKNMADAETKRFYENDKILEIIINLSLQKLQSKEWEDNYEGEFFLSQEDLLDIEQVINEEILPFEESRQMVLLNHIYSGKISDYCEPLFEITEEEEEGDFITNSCVKKDASVNFFLTIQSGKSFETYEFILENFYPVVTNTGEYIILDVKDLKVNLL